MIIVLEEDWGVSEQGTDDYVFPEYSDSESSWYDRLKKIIGDILFGS